MKSHCIVVCEKGELVGFWNGDTEEQVDSEQEAEWYDKYEDAEKALGEIPRKIDARIWQLQPAIAVGVTRAAPVELLRT